MTLREVTPGSTVKVNRRRSGKKAYYGHGYYQRS